MAFVLTVLLATAAPAAANEPSEHQHRTLTDVRVAWPSWDQVARVITLRDYNTRVVAAGTLMLGVAAAMVGVFMLLRRRSLVGDVIGHASFPGIAIAFLTLELLAPNTGKSMPLLLAGAFVSGLIGVACTTLILRNSRVKEDAALAIVLSVFFGLGIVLFTVIQRMPTGNAAGLQHFIFGKAASMVARDVLLIGAASVTIMLTCAVLFKEFALLSFDERFGAAQGWPVLLLDLGLMSLVAGVTVVALQSVGMLLAVAMLVTPAAAARFWTDHLVRMTILAAFLGGLAALLGVFASALFPRLAAGAVIVLASSSLFAFSMFCGARRGILVRVRRQWRLRRKVGRDHLLRAFFEQLESQLPRAELQHNLHQHFLGERALRAHRSWSPTEFTRLLRNASRAGLIAEGNSGEFRLTEFGADEARTVVRNHRLWEMYLIEYADIAPSHVDRDADDIEHLLGHDVVTALEESMKQQQQNELPPPSPHTIAPANEVNP